MSQQTGRLFNARGSARGASTARQLATLAARTPKPSAVEPLRSKTMPIQSTTDTSSWTPMGYDEPSKAGAYALGSIATLLTLIPIANCGIAIAELGGRSVVNVNFWFYYNVTHWGLCMLFILFGTRPLFATTFESIRKIRWLLHEPLITRPDDFIKWLAVKFALICILFRTVHFDGFVTEFNDHRYYEINSLPDRIISLWYASLSISVYLGFSVAWSIVTRFLPAAVDVRSDAEADNERSWRAVNTIDI